MRITDATLKIACRIPSDGSPTENTIHDLSLDLKEARARIRELEARTLEAARIFMAVRNVFGPVSYSDDAEGETWAKIDEWLTIKHSKDCEFHRTGNCTCSSSSDPGDPSAPDAGKAQP